jgi:hypothetical protein
MHHRQTHPHAIPPTTIPIKMARASPTAGLIAMPRWSSSSGSIQGGIPGGALGDGEGGGGDGGGDGVGGALGGVGGNGGAGGTFAQVLAEHVHGEFTRHPPCGS